MNSPREAQPTTSRQSATHPGRGANPDQGTTAVMNGACIGHHTALLLTVFFTLLMIAPAVLESRSTSDTSLLTTFRKDARKFGVQLALQEVERHFIYDSFFANAVRQPYQRFLIRRLGQGSRSVVLGTDGFLFHRNDVVSVAGPGVLSPDFMAQPDAGTDVIEQFVNRTIKRWRNGTPDQTPAIPRPPFANSIAVLSDFDATLNARGVHLLVVVVPGKSTIYPERLWPGYPAKSGPAWNADFVEWKTRLTGLGVDLLDLSDEFWRAKDTAGEALFLQHDTHWLPRGVALAARAVGERVKGFLVGEESVALSTSTKTIVEPADLLGLLGLRADSSTFQQRPVELLRVSGDVATDDRARVLLFGDSLTGYYDDNGAGLAEQLTLQLHTGVQRFVGFGEALPQAIRTAVATHPDLLRNKRVVVLEFHMNQLYLKTFSALLPGPPPKLP